MAEVQNTAEKAKLPSDEVASEQAYERWKDAKVRDALAETENRESMIAASDVWERFGFER